MTCCNNWSLFLYVHVYLSVVRRRFWGHVPNNIWIYYRLPLKHSEILSDLWKTVLKFYLECTLQKQNIPSRWSELLIRMCNDRNLRPTWLQVILLYVGCTKDSPVIIFNETFSVYCVKVCSPVWHQEYLTHDRNGRYNTLSLV